MLSPFSLLKVQVTNLYSAHTGIPYCRNQVRSRRVDKLQPLEYSATGQRGRLWNVFVEGGRGGYKGCAMQRHPGGHASVETENDCRDGNKNPLLPTIRTIISVTGRMAGAQDRAGWRTINNG